jgi:hypothetical protein
MRNAESCGVPIPERESKTRAGFNSKASATAARFIESNLKPTCLREEAGDVRGGLFSHPNTLLQILYGLCSVGAGVFIVETFDSTVFIHGHPTTTGQQRAELTEGDAEELLVGRGCNPRLDDDVDKSDSVTAVGRQTAAGLSVFPQAKFHSPLAFHAT